MLFLTLPQDKLPICVSEIAYSGATSVLFSFKLFSWPVFLYLETQSLPSFHPVPFFELNVYLPTRWKALWGQVLYLSSSLLDNRAELTDWCIINIQWPNCSPPHQPYSLLGGSVKPSLSCLGKQDPQVPAAERTSVLNTDEHLQMVPGLFSTFSTLCQIS